MSLKEKIQAAKDAYHAAARKLGSLENQCKHEKFIMEQAGGAYCDTCSISLGWWCPDAPNHLCSYPDSGDQYHDEKCKFCGEPDERK